MAVGDALPDMPVFLEPGQAVDVPLEATYQAAYAKVPRRWRRVLEANWSHGFIHRLDWHQTLLCERLYAVKWKVAQKENPSAMNRRGSVPSIGPARAYGT